VSLKDGFNKKFGGGAATSSELDEEYQNIDWIDTGSASLNFAIHPSGRGIPTSNIVEIPGLSSSGKTLIANHILRNTIRKDGIAVLGDVEDAHDTALAKNIDLDSDKLIVLSPSVVEKDNTVKPLSFTEMFQRFEYIIDETHRQYGRDKLLTLVLDSLGAMPFSQDLEGDAPKATQGAQAKEIGIWLKRLRAKVTKSNTLFIIINQMYDNISATPTATKYISRGGKSVGYQSQIRVMFDAVDGKAGKIYDSDKNIIGARLFFKVIKNRIAKPFNEGSVDWLFGANNIPELKYYSGFFNYLVESGKAEKGTGKISIGEDVYRCRQEGTAYNPIYVAEDSVIERLLTEHPELLEK
jgi:recombination protein RecA